MAVLSDHPWRTRLSAEDRPPGACRAVSMNDRRAALLGIGNRRRGTRRPVTPMPMPAGPVRPSATTPSSGNRPPRRGCPASGAVHAPPSARHRRPARMPVCRARHSARSKADAWLSVNIPPKPVCCNACEISFPSRQIAAIQVFIGSSDKPYNAGRQSQFLFESLYKQHVMGYLYCRNVLRRSP